MMICDVLKDVIQNGAEIHSEKCSLIIKETGKEAGLKEVTLNDLSSSHATFAWKLDWKNKLSPYFKDGKGLDKGCDAVIVTNIESRWYIFIVELKSNPERKIQEICQQFNSSLCFVKYIQAILRIIYEHHDINKIDIHFILFSKNNNNLVSTNSPQNQTHNYLKDKDGKSIIHIQNDQYSIKKLINTPSHH